MEVLAISNPRLSNDILGRRVSRFAGLFHGQEWTWWDSFKENVAAVASSAGLNYPGPSGPYAPQLLNAQTLSYLFISNPLVADGLIWGAAAGMMMLYFHLRNKDNDADSRIDSAFVAALALAVTYHRYYDGQLLLLLVPAAVYLWQIGSTKTSVVLGICFALLAFPLQSIFDRTLGLAANHHLVVQFVLLRHQPLAIIVVVVALSVRSLTISDIVTRTSPWVKSCSNL